LYRRVLVAREHSLGNDHPDTMVTRNSLAWWGLEKQGRHDEAAAVFLN
jgi:tetratricopeptide repeat protein